MRKMVREWLYFAEEDLKSAKILMREGIYNQVAFHSQQCAEKCLKALIEKHTIVPKIHKLLDLLELCIKSEPEVEVFSEELTSLDKFYTSTRYPFIIGMLSDRFPAKQDAEKSLKFAESIYIFANKIIEQE